MVEWYSLRVREDESFRAMLLLRGLARVAKKPDPGVMLDSAVFKFSDTSKWAALNLLLKRSRWHRTWIIQQCAVARNVMIMCGYRDITLTDLIQAMRLIENLIERKPMWPYIGKVSVLGVNALQRTRMRVAVRGDRDLQSLSYEGSDSLLEVLSRCRASLATDPGVKVYALLRLARDSRQAASEVSLQPILVDYARSEEDVYLDVVKLFLASTNRLNFLSCCRSKRVVGLPSWVPDWSDTNKEPYSLFGSSSATGGSSAVAHINGLELTVRRFLFDCVRFLSTACDASDFSSVSASSTFR